MRVKSVRDVVGGCLVLALAALAACGGDPVRPPGGDDGDLELPGSWSTAAALPEAVSAAGGGVLGGRIYVVGGAIPNQAEGSARAYRYDPAVNTWERLTDLPEGLMRPGVAVLDGTLLVIGGNLHSNQLTPRSNVWAWNDAGRAWVHHSTLPIPSSGPRTASTGAGIVATTLGSLQGAPGDSTALLAAGTTTWRYGPPQPLSVSILAPMANGAWAVGSLEHAVFDATASAWTGKASKPSGFLVGAWAVPGRRHLLTREATVASHHVLSEATGSWSLAAAPQVNTNRIDAVSVAVGERLYLIGGFEAGSALARVDVFTMN